MILKELDDISIDDHCDDSNNDVDERMYPDEYQTTEHHEYPELKVLSDYGESLISKTAAFEAQIQACKDLLQSTEGLWCWY